jgi:hypothetical protein
MKITGFLKLLNKGNAWSFIFLFMRHPFNFIPTFIATYQCVKISDEHYGNLHHQNNVTNAFRHALWNYLIAKKCSAWRRNKRKAIQFSEKITNWHEEFSPNAPLEKEMDLHNNYIGRKLFIQENEESTDIFVNFLKDKVSSAKRIESIEDIKLYRNDLVYIHELD